jgi:glycosyltransferase involved in cell wall biosynthesis
VLDLAGALARRRDVGISLVCRRGDGARWRDLGLTSVTEAAPEARPLRLVWEQRRLPEVLEALVVDVHHAPHYTMPAKAGRPVVVTVHDLSFADHPEWHQRSKALFFRRALRRAAQRADALVAVSTRTADRLRELYTPRGAVHVIPHGVDHLRFRPAPEEAAADAAALRRAGTKPPYVAFIGTLEPRKDVPTLVRAFARLAPSQPELTLLLAGAPGWGARQVDEAVAHSGVPERIVRPGYVDEVDKPALLRRAAVVAYPSLEEGFGLPALEALACGTPLVTTADSVMADVVGDAALLVPACDPEALAAALEAALEGGAEARRRRDIGLAVAGRHTWETSAAAHASVYRSLA